MANKSKNITVSMVEYKDNLKLATIKGYKAAAVYDPATNTILNFIGENGKVTHPQMRTRHVFEKAIDAKLAGDPQVSLFEEPAQEDATEEQAEENASEEQQDEQAEEPVEPSQEEAQYADADVQALTEFLLQNGPSSEYAICKHFNLKSKAFKDLMQRAGVEPTREEKDGKVRITYAC